jgi:hypothetical protein
MTARSRNAWAVAFVTAFLAAAHVATAQDGLAQDGAPAPDAPAAVVDAAAPEAAVETPEAPVAPTLDPVATDAPPEAAAEPAVEVEPVEEAAEVGEDDPAESASDEEASKESAVEEEAAAVPGIDWGGLFERAPAFFSVTHPAVVHLPIALWLVGALFVLIGLVVPSWSRQVPLACLWVGAISSIPSTLTGWWNADENGYEGWREFDWESVTVQHRWLAVALTVVSLMLCVLSIVASSKQSRFWGFVWRTGLIALAIGVGYAGHLGGEIAKGEGFLEEAFEAWVNPEE